MPKTTAVAKAADSTVSPVSTEQTLKASKALLAHIKKAVADPESGKKKNLLADEEIALAETPVWLTLTTKSHIHESSRLQPGKIVLPHPLNTDEESTICVITADPQRWYKNMVASEVFPEDLRKRITRIIDISHLTKKFSDYAAQRKLFSEHDIFLADDRVVNRLPKVLGKTFFKTTVKRPVPVILMKPKSKVDGKRIATPKGRKEKRDPIENPNVRPVPEIVAELRKAIGAALVHLSPSTNTAIKVGYADWKPENLAENVEKVVSDLVERFVPKKWNNIRNIYIKGPETAALPIYQTDELWLDESKVVADEKDKKGEKANIGKKRKSLDAEAEAEAVEAAPAEVEDRPKKKAKKAKAALPESNDDRLDKEIAERKTKLKKQKAAAKKAIEA